MAATQTSAGHAASNNGHPGAHRSAGLTQKQRQAWGNAVSQIQQALETRGVDTASALRFATLLTRQPGVEILLNGKGVRYHGQIFDPAAFAHSHLADWVTGEAAKTANQAILQGDPGYQSALAQLRLNQQTATAGLDDAQRRAVIEYGGGQFAGSDPLLAQQAAANPNSILQSLLRSDAQRRAAAAEQAARYGTTQGGAYQSALSEAGRVNVAGQQEGLDALTQALQQITSQKALAGAAYTTGAGQAASDATQRLLSQGLWHTTAPPSVTSGRVAFYHPPRPKRPRAPGAPPPPPPPP